MVTLPLAAMSWPFGLSGETVNAFVQSVITIFAIVDPVGCLPLFVGLTEQVPAENRRRLFRFAGLIAFVVICIMAVIGKYLLTKVFGIGFDEFMFGGGLMLIVVGLQGILERPKKPTVAEKQTTQELATEQIRLAVSPIAMPLLAGPGAIVTVMLIANRFTVWFALAACVVCFIFVLAILNWSHLVFRVLGRLGTLAVARVMDIFIVAIGVRFIFDGTFGYLISHFPNLIK